MEISDLLDIVDDEWMMDTLPDDDIPMPATVSYPNDENEETQDADARQEPQKWNELGLHGIQ